MTEQELSELHALERQIKRLQWRLKEAEHEDIGAINYDGMPHASNPGNPTERIAMKKAELREMLSALLEEKIQKQIEIQRFIESIEDEEIKDIADMRFISCMNWVDIAAEISIKLDYDVDRTTVAKKLRRFLKKFEEI